MDIAIVNTTVYKDAKALGACDKVMGNWTGLYDMDDLISLFKSNQEFCIEHDFPNKEFIKSVTKLDERISNNMFVDDKVAVHGKSGTMVILGDSVGFVNCDGFDALTIYVRHESRINISAKGFSRVFIRAYDNCKLSVEQSEMSKVYVYRYGKNSEIDVDGDVNFQQK